MKYAQGAQQARDAGIDPAGPIIDIIDFFEMILATPTETEEGYERRIEQADEWAFKYDAGYTR